MEPLRIMESGEWEYDLDSTRIMDFPKQWPGTIYSSLIAIHWELIIEFNDDDGEVIKWVSPVYMPQSDDRTEIAIAPVRSGRAELSNY